MSPQNVRLIFGAYNIDDLLQSGTHPASPREIIVHKDWDPNVERFDADIALLITDHDIPTTIFINPICLWEGSSQLSVDDGWIAGWGKTRESTTYLGNIPKQLRIPIKTQEDCFLDNPAFTKLASNRTFCGGSRDGSGPCLGEQIFL